MDLTGHFLPAVFPPQTRVAVDALEAALLPAIAAHLHEPPSRDSLAARSSELIPLLEDLLADCTAFALACERNEPEETKAQLRAVARYASEALVELLDGMTWTVDLGSVPAPVKLTEQEGEWSYAVKNCQSAKFPTKAAAREAASAAVRELGLANAADVN